MTETVVVAGEGITLDLLLWRRWGDAGASLLSAALDLNRGLASLGPVLPAGTAVVLPEAPTKTATVTVAVDLFS